MKRLFLLAICLSFAVFADVPMWQRNNGAWEAILRVNKEDAFIDVGDFRAVTNGIVHHVETTVTTTVLYRVDYVGRRLLTSGSSAGQYHVEAWRDFARGETGFGSLDFVTNALIAKFDTVTMNIQALSTNVASHSVDRQTTGDLPCRFGVPATVAVDLPYTDLLEMLPLDWPDTYIRVRTGFDGYLLLRFDENEMRLTIKRLLPEKLPYERTPQNLRVRRADLLYGI